MSTMEKPLPATFITRTRPSFVRQVLAGQYGNLVRFLSLALTLLVWEWYGRGVDPVFLSYPTAILVFPTPAGPSRVSSRVSSRSMSSANALSSASRPIGLSAKTGSNGMDGSWKLAEANRAERSDSGRLSPSANSRMVVSRGERRPRSSSETASGLRPARAARVSCERPERLRRRRSSSPNRFIFSLPHCEGFLPDC